ncbi:MAG: ATP-binding protein [Fimbriimonadaceae bacterium]|nr:ATP-binding protein [Fimbriimonadaceae bacterium]
MTQVGHDGAIRRRAVLACTRWSGSMLLEFSVTNFRSFDERQTISMVASKDNTSPGSVLATELHRPTQALKSAAIFGPNASGKTNLLGALAWMRRFVLDSARGQMGDAITVDPFLLGRGPTGSPSTFEVSLAIGPERYDYGFSVNGEQVVEEWLDAVRVRTRRLFERREGNIQVGPSWDGDEGLAGRTRENALFLSRSGQDNAPGARPLLKWFRDMLAVGVLHSIEAPGSYLARQVHGDAVLAATLAQIARLADLGIERIAATTLPEAQEVQRRAIEDALRPVLGAEAELSVGPALRLVISRWRADGVLVDFSESAESKGTLKFLALVAACLQQRQAGGGLLLVDEFDSQLHPVLVEELLGLINRQPGHSQVILATHHPAVLDQQLLRRDQVWFAEKGPDQATRLYSLWDFRKDIVRKDDRFGAAYLRGRYGAIPAVGDLDSGAT